MGIRKLSRLLEEFHQTQPTRRPRIWQPTTIHSIVVDGPGLIHALAPLFEASHVLEFQHDSIQSTIRHFISLLRQHGITDIVVWFDGGVEEIKSNTTRKRREELYRRTRDIQREGGIYLKGGLRSPWLMYWFQYFLRENSCICRVAPKEADNKCVEATLQSGGTLVGDDSDYFMSFAPYVNLKDLFQIDKDGSIVVNTCPPTFCLQRLLHALGTTKETFNNISFWLGDDYNHSVLCNNKTNTLLALIELCKRNPSKVPRNPSRCPPSPRLKSIEEGLRHPILHDIQSLHLAYLPCIYDDVHREHSSAWRSSEWIRSDMYASICGANTTVTEFLRHKCHLKGHRVIAKRNKHTKAILKKIDDMKSLLALFRDSSSATTTTRAWAVWQCFFTSFFLYVQRRGGSIPDDWWDWTKDTIRRAVASIVKESDWIHT